MLWSVEQQGPITVAEMLGPTIELIIECPFAASSLHWNPLILTNIIYKMSRKVPVSPSLHDESTTEPDSDSQGILNPLKSNSTSPASKLVKPASV